MFFLSLKINAQFFMFLHVIRVHVVAVRFTACPCVAQTGALELNVRRARLEESTAHKAARHARHGRYGYIDGGVLWDRQRGPAISHGIRETTASLVSM